MTANRRTALLRCLMLIVLSITSTQAAKTVIAGGTGYSVSYPAAASVQLGTQPEQLSLVVWRDSRPGGSSGAQSIRASRVTTSLEVLDPGEGIELDERGGTDLLQYPDVAGADVDSFFAVWDHQVPNTESYIRGRVVRQNGDIGDLVTICHSSGVVRSAAIARCDDVYLVVWQDPRNEGVYGARMTLGGEVLDPEGIRISPAEPGILNEQPDVASDGTRFLVVWHRLEADAVANAHGALVETGGTVGLPFQISEYTQATFPAIAYDDGSYLVVWLQLTWPDQNNDVRGRVVDVGGGMARPSFCIYDEEDTWKDDPAVCFGIVNYFAAFTQRLYGFEFDIAGRRASPGSIVTGPPEDICRDPGPQRSSDVTFDRRNFLVVWQEGSSNPIIYGDTVSPWQSHFWSQVGHATYPNQGRSLALDPTTGVLHRVYSSNDSVFYTYSEDQGEHWTPWEYVGRGHDACVACENQTANPVWVSFVSDKKILCKARWAAGNWVEHIVFWGDDALLPKAPSMSGCYNWATDPAPVYVAFSIVFGGESSIMLAVVDAEQGVVCLELVDPPGGGVVHRTPSVATSPGDVVHVVWQRDDANRIYYRQWYYRVWSDIAEVSSHPRYPEAEPAFDPCVEAYGDSVHVVWHGRDQSGSLEGDVWRRSKVVEFDPTFYLIPDDQSRTEGDSSAYPQNSTNAVTAWQEWPMAEMTWDIWANIIDNVVTIYHDPGPWYCRYPDIVAELPEPGQPFQIYVNTTWTNVSHSGGLAPFEVLFKRYKFMPTDGGEDFAYYGCGVGDSVRSRYCLSRDGYARWRSFSVDYGREGLRYRLPYLNPNCLYKLRAILYQVSRSTWEQSLAFDGMPAGRFSYRSNVPETVWVTIPQELYRHDCEVSLEVSRLSGDLAVMADIRLYQCYPYRQRGGDGVQGTPLASSQALLGAPNANPFKSRTRISYTAPANGPLSLKVYDLQGRVVKELASGVHEAGSYEVCWNGTDQRDRRVPAGAYFFRLVSDHATETRKVLLTR